MDNGQTAIKMGEFMDIQIPGKFVELKITE